VAFLSPYFRMKVRAKAVGKKKRRSFQARAADNIQEADECFPIIPNKLSDEELAKAKKRKK